MQPGDPAWNPSWKNRRRTIFGTLYFCAFWVSYIIILDSGSALHREVAQSLILLAMGVIASYVFGAVWQDTSIRKNANV